MPDIKQLLETNTASGERRTIQVFQDFCELSALTIRNAVDRDGFDTREARYLTIAATYTPEEMNRFAAALAHLTMALSDLLSDGLGHLYMSLDLGNEHLGQFFTPYDVSLLAASMTSDDMVSRLQTQEFITISEPTSGSGGMVIAIADLLSRSGVNYQKAIHVTTQDIDITAVHMTYVQLALLHIPALVVHGDVLTLEERDVWPTPVHVLDGWDMRLREAAAPELIRCGTASGAEEGDG
ncbi:N-6 DNA methylase [Saccharothrix sp. AJ9571]|nr:N-6 DNA methylase [Saccharothrix sp. AJ9571]